MQRDVGLTGGAVVAIKYLLITVGLGVAGFSYAAQPASGQAY